ncbi:DUF4012 domain-containing protein [Streptomyces sp. GC420]|uniref:DUF4012 domain-containing protein n=1 Tax=Streptomyces sp. GC420 TaxID=2697568 RepID=UPI001414F881|nr:DUF4012 domain-containing protein [Streptomyces sp. GC420]NBM17520.1 DUF4012 domain-containing protein [Streptomyces sp. GC420]
MRLQRFPESLRRFVGALPVRRRVLRRRTGILLGAVALILIGTGWIAVTGLLARAELLAAQRALDVLRRSATDTGSTGATTSAVRSAVAHADRAHHLTTGPAWYLASRLPWLGDPLETARGAAAATDRLTQDVVRPLAGLAPGLIGAGHQGGFPAVLSALGGQASVLDRAARAAAEVRAETGRLPHATWLPAVDRARARLAGELDRIVPATADISVAARVLPPMLGQHGTRRYLVVFQNTAEARGTGGLPGAFAVLTARGGRVGFESFGTDSMLNDVNPPIDLGPEYTARYGTSAPSRVWVNSNVSPHFPHAARIWAATWQTYSGRPVDGALALDPSALSLLLRATGPGQLPDGTAVTAGNVLELTERTGYARYQVPAERKEFLLDVARTAATTLMNAMNDPQRLPALLTAAHDAVREGRLKAWSGRPEEQRLLRQRPLSGALPRADGPFTGLVLNNAAGGKLDYYLERKVDWIPGRCTPDGREVTARIAFTNHAPVSGLPLYVTQRGDRPPYPTRPGDNRVLASYYASEGALMTGATLDGRPVTLDSGAERGHPVYTLDLELPVGKTRTLTLRLLEPRSERPPVVWRQQLVAPLRTAVAPYPACGG